MEIQDKWLLKPGDFKPSHRGWKIDGVLNPGGARLKNGKIVLYVRVAESTVHTHGTGRVCPVMTSKESYSVHYQKIRAGEIDRNRLSEQGEFYLKEGLCRLPNISHFRRVILSKDGFRIEKIEQNPAFFGIPGESEYGVEDARITKIENRYYMTYVGISLENGVSTYLASSTDLIKWKRHGLIFREQNKDCVLFPEKVQGEYVAFNRPETLFSFSKPGIWISYSPDLIYWGRESSIMKPRDKSVWEKSRIGGGTPPIKTKKGWVAIYHGMIGENNSRVYSAGAVLLNLKHPKKIIARSGVNVPLIRPDKVYEKVGFVDNVIFPTTAISTLDGKGLLIYSGGADSNVSVRELSWEYIWKNLGIK